VQNPDWTRDELILALELYFRLDHRKLTSTNEEIVELSHILNQLPIHKGEPHDSTFRNPSGVAMKLSNFLHLDENYDGAGLHRGSKLDKAIWDEFSFQRELLSQTASSILRNYSEVVNIPEEIEQEEEFKEGKVLTRLHKLRERNRKVVEKKKKAVLEANGALKCEVCSFDFYEVYGDIGMGFAECHHIVPLFEIKAEKASRLEDLAIVCANCHRMLHKNYPMTISELRSIVYERSQ
jgi:5-methylcytosine-specific restriction protein A